MDRTLEASLTVRLIRQTVSQVAKLKLLKLDNQVRFITAVVEERLVVIGKVYDEQVADLVQMNFDKLKRDGDDEESFSYLLKMPIKYMSNEFCELLKEEYEEQKKYVAELERTTPNVKASHA